MQHCCSSSQTSLPTSMSLAQGGSKPYDPALTCVSCKSPLSLPVALPAWQRAPQEGAGWPEAAPASLLSETLRRWLHCLGWQFQAAADNHYLWWYHGNSRPVFTDMGRYSLFPWSSSGPGAPNSHQRGGCFVFAVTLHICNFPESLASVPNSPALFLAEQNVMPTD